MPHRAAAAQVLTLNGTLLTASPLVVDGGGDYLVAQFGSTYALVTDAGGTWQQYNTNITDASGSNSEGCYWLAVSGGVPYIAYVDAAGTRRWPTPPTARQRLDGRDRGARGSSVRPRPGGQRPGRRRGGRRPGRAVPLATFSEGAHSGLAAGASYTDSESVNIPASASASAGAQHLIFQTNATGSLTEASTSTMHQSLHRGPYEVPPALGVRLAEQFQQ